MTDRLNARMDADLARKVKYLRSRTGQSTTEVIKASIEMYYERVAQQEAPAELLSDFVACAEGPRDLSETYKARLAQSLDKKGRR